MWINWLVSNCCFLPITLIAWILYNIISTHRVANFIAFKCTANYANRQVGNKDPILLSTVIDLWFANELLKVIKWGFGLISNNL